MRYFQVAREKIIEYPEERLGSVFEFAGLVFDASMLEFEKADRTVKTASVRQVLKNLNSSFVSKLSRYGDAFEEMIDTIDHPAFESLLSRENMR